MANALSYNDAAVVSTNFQEFWSNCVCVFDALDSIITESNNMDDSWHSFKIQMTAIVNEEWNNCTKLADTDQRHK